MLLEKVVAAVCLLVVSPINAIIVDFYRSKALGMQTLMDSLYLDFIFHHGLSQFLACSFTFLPKPVPTLPALILTRIPHIFALAMFFQLSVVAVGKYVHVYQQHLILAADLTDKEIVNRIRILTFVVVSIAEFVAIYNGHAYAEYEYLTGECYQGICDRGQVAVWFILLAFLLNGGLSLTMFIQERRRQKRIFDQRQQSLRQEDSAMERERRRKKMIRTLIAFFFLSVYIFSMILMRTHGKNYVDNEEIIRCFLLITICIIFPSVTLLLKNNYRCHTAKRMAQLWAKITP